MGAVYEDQKILLVTGKGGVGKSTVAAALAHRRANEGRSTLLVELGEKSYYSWVYGREIGYQPVTLAPNLDVCLLRGEESLKEFLAYYIRVKRVIELFFDNKVMRSLVRAAPALKELALLGKLTSGLRGVGPDFGYDDVIVDCFSSGHFRALMDVPQGMLEAVQRGPMGDQCREIDRALKSSSVQTCLVTLPEELPVTETLELGQDLRQRGQNFEVCLNQFLDLQTTSENLATYARESSSPQSEFLEAQAHRLTRQQEALDRLQALEAPLVKSPVLFHAKTLDCIKELSELLEGR